MMKVEQTGDAINASVEIAAPPEAVFEALTNPKELAEWWGADAIYRTANWQLDLNPPGAWSCETNDSQGNHGAIHGHILEVQRPRALSYTWNPSWAEVQETVVHYRLESESPSATRLLLTHSGFGANTEQLQSHLQGWSRVLVWLREHLDSRNPGYREPDAIDQDQLLA